MSAKNPFSDVKENQWYTDAVQWANAEGLILGRTETAAILMRFSAI